jgi:hypothetical protein
VIETKKVSFINMCSNNEKSLSELKGYSAKNFLIFQLQDFITSPTEVIGQNCRINLLLIFHFYHLKKFEKNMFSEDRAHYNMEPLFTKFFVT